MRLVENIRFKWHRMADFVDRDYQRRCGDVVNERAVRIIPLLITTQFSPTLPVLPSCSFFARSPFSRCSQLRHRPDNPHFQRFVDEKPGLNPALENPKPKAQDLPCLRRHLHRLSVSLFDQTTAASFPPNPSKEMHRTVAHRDVILAIVVSMQIGNRFVRLVRNVLGLGPRNIALRFHNENRLAKPVHDFTDGSPSFPSKTVCGPLSTKYEVFFESFASAADR